MILKKRRMSDNAPCPTWQAGARGPTSTGLPGGTRIQARAGSECNLAVSQAVWNEKLAHMAGRDEAERVSKIVGLTGASPCPRTILGLCTRKLPATFPQLARKDTSAD